jgi:hypothetical protein
LAFSGAQAPGLPDGVHFGSFNDARVRTAYSLNGVGHVAIASLLAGPGVTEENNLALWMGAPDDLQLRVRSGDEAIGLPGVRFGPVFGPRLNNADTMLFSSFLAGASIDASNDRSLWQQKSSGEMRLVIRKGDSLPGLADGAVVDSVLVAAMDASDNVGMTALLRGDAIDDSNRNIVNYYQPAHGLRIVARTGASAFDGTGNIRFEAFGSDVIMNEQGWMIFTARLIGDGITINNNDGIWAYHPDHGRHLLAREGDEVEVAPGVFRRYRNSALVTASGGEDGLDSGFNRYGEFVFMNEFWDSRYGILEIVVPEPASLSLVCVVPLLMQHGRRAGRPV